MSPLYLKTQKGVVSLITLLALSAVSLSIIVSISTAAIDELKMTNSGGVIDQTFYAAEAGLNEGLYHLIQNPVPGSYSFDLDGVTVNITIGINPENHYQRIVRSQAIDSRGKIRTVAVIADTNSFAGGFDYAIQGGSGGIFLDNNSEVIGGVYSNGSILPASGGATGSISGNVWVADSHTLDRVNITGDAHAHTITRSSISGKAYYNTIDGGTKVSGSFCPNSNCFAGSTDPEVRPFPINDDDVNNWKQEIVDAGNPVLTANPSSCPPSHPIGFYCVTSNGTLGYQKIDADFYVGNGATLTLTGNLWISGKIILDNNGTIQLDPTLDYSSVVIITDGIVDVNNNYTITGSGQPGSFVLILSTNSSVNLTAPAIWASNNSDSIIFAAIHGLLKVKQNGSLNAAAAETLHLENNATVTYNPMLASFVVGDGGGEEIGTSLGSWREL